MYVTIAKLCPEIAMDVAATTTRRTNDAIHTDSQASCALHVAHWYAIYTLANHEKRVSDEIAARGIERYLPLCLSLRRWKDRRVELERPLFPGYVFAHFPLSDKLKVLQVPSVVRFVGFNGQPTALPDDEFEILRAGLAERTRVEPCPFLSVGRRVRIVAGPFTGLAGMLKQKRNGLRVVVSLELIQRSLAVDVKFTDIVPIP
jgi:transcription antitermination factor NusG